MEMKNKHWTYVWMMNIAIYNFMFIQLMNWMYWWYKMKEYISCVLRYEFYMEFIKALFMHIKVPVYLV